MRHVKYSFKYMHKCDIAFFIALLLKIFSAGIHYFPILDDHIQYGSYPLFPLSHVLFGIGTAGSRPFASFLDPTFWGLFYNHMWIALLLITVMYFVSAVFLDRILIEHHIKITPFLYCFFLLAPITFEGTYWISASTRIVVGMFFATSATILLMLYLNQKKKRTLTLYIIFTLLSFGFYESVMVFSLILQSFVIIKRVLKYRNKRPLRHFIIPFSLAFLMVMYYMLASKVFLLGSRATTSSVSGMSSRIGDFISQFFYTTSAGFFRTTFIGFWDGLVYIFSSWWSALILLPLILAVSTLCAIYSKKHKIRGRVNSCVPLGLAMIFLPLLPHLLVPDVWLTYRSIFLCIPGFCIACAPLGHKFLKKHKPRQILVFLLVFLFSVGCVNEVNTYKRVSKTDALIAENITSVLDEEVLSGKKEAVLVLPHEIIIPQTSYYKDHVKSVASSDWALTGALRAKTKNNNIPYITPVYSLDGVDTDGKQVLYMDENYQVTEEVHE